MIKWWATEMGAEEEQLVQSVLRTHYVNEGDTTSIFESKLQEILNCPHIIATTSGTAALYLGARALGIGPGDEVIVPDVTFIATANAIQMTGAKVVLADVDEKTLLLSPKTVEKLITPRTKAIVPVHISGRCAPLSDLQTLASKHRLLILEDAAEAFGSFHNEKSLGTIGDIGVFSFSANKVITMGQGGVVATRSSEIARQVRMLKDQGRPTKGTGGDDIHNIAGFNSKLTNLQAAVGLGQLTRLQTRWNRLRKNHEIYLNELAHLSDIQILPFDLKAGHQPLWTDILLDHRDRLDAYLARNGFECRRYWHPIHRQKPYLCTDDAFPVSTKNAPRALWLPSSFLLTDDMVVRICKLIKEFYEKRSHHLEEYSTTSP